MASWINYCTLVGIIVIAVSVVYMESGDVSGLSEPNPFGKKFWEDLWASLKSIFSPTRCAKMALILCLVPILSSFTKITYGLIGLIVVCSGVVGLFLGFLSLFKDKSWNLVKCFYRDNDIRPIMELFIVIALSVQGINGGHSLFWQTHFPELIGAELLLLFCIIRPRKPSQIQATVDLACSVLAVLAAGYYFF